MGFGIFQAPLDSSSGGRSGSTKTIYKNVTEYVEVPNYIDRETIIQAEEKIPEEVEETKPVSLFLWIFLIIFFVLSLFGFIFYFIKRGQNSPGGSII